MVIDPRRTRTAEAADEHHFIRPGTDAHLLFAHRAHAVRRGPRRPGRARASTSTALDEVEALAARLHARGGGAGVRHRRRARSAASRASWPRAERAAVYGRIGTCTQEFGTLASWLVDVLNVLTGNLDRAGGAMFTRAAAGAAQHARRAGHAAGASRIGRWQSRVRGLPEVLGELPVSCLAEEIETPGRGPDPRADHDRRQPAASRTPNAARLERGARVARLHGLRRHLPERDDAPRRRDPARPGPLEQPHYDLALYQLAVRNVANYSPAVFAAPTGVPQEWETLLRLAGIVVRPGPGRRRRRRSTTWSSARWSQREVGDRALAHRRPRPGEILAALEPRRGPERDRST